ncbi:neuropeptide SIFamide receptor-like isoform X2 [Daktulosphaira vitifoliae]|uniref:neuropeptide SIFamide receptor-like isoform X2 n=1 Tax=Daktulosphaira vitifoliae TaxID=58002 RepID=UPI0021AA23F0|nr:neuropeptide SIFamide receptor-like isoform X2 [Daktulosphaira vitifoliae]
MVNLKLITKLVIFVVHIIVFLIGLIGNMMVISVVFRIPRMQNTTNYFIANLAMADIFVTLITLPLHFFFNFDMIENLPTWACKLTSYISCVALTASVYCLIIVSIDRASANTTSILRDECDLSVRLNRSTIPFALG